MVEVWQVQEALRPLLGSSLLDEFPGFGTQVARRLQSWFPGRSTLEELTAQVDETLFNELYECLGPAMTVVSDDGFHRRIYMDELRDASDDLLGLLFDSFPVDSLHFEELHRYCMTSCSLSALRTLWIRYRDQLDPGERNIISRIIRDNYPASRWISWLKLED